MTEPNPFEEDLEDEAAEPEAPASDAPDPVPAPQGDSGAAS